MPWNDTPKSGPWGAPPPGGGGQGGPPGGDGGGGPGGPNRPRGEPPKPRRNPQGGGPSGGQDFERLVGELNQKLKDFFQGPGGGVRPEAAGAVIGAVVALWLLSGVFVVQPDQEGVVTTFGAYNRTVGPGLGYHLPAPVEAVEKVPVTSLQRIDIGEAAGSDSGSTETLMLTGDENIVDLDFSVSWRIADAGAYLFNLRDPDQAVRDVAESAMRQVVGQMPLQAILTTGRGDVQTRTADLMQKTLDSYDAGVTVVEVQIRAANPPAEVVQAFREVANAGQEAESAVNEANTYKNRVVNEAKGDAAKITASGEAYREQAVREAEGDAARFNQVYEQYKKAPAVTRERLYLETMERVLAKSNKVIVDGKGTSAPIILPPDVFKPRGAAAEAPPPPPPAANDAGASNPSAEPSAPQPQAQSQAQSQAGA